MTHSIGEAWSYRSYVKASNTDAGDTFGLTAALSADGTTLAVGARAEDSAVLDIGGIQANNTATDAGAGAGGGAGGADGVGGELVEAVGIGAGSAGVGVKGGDVVRIRCRYDNTLRSPFLVEARPSSG